MQQFWLVVGSQDNWKVAFENGNIGGDIFQAMAKLKHAFDLWDSKVFLVAGVKDRPKYEDLLSGTFHEIANLMQFIDVRLVRELLQKKRDYKEMDKSLGIMRT